MIRVTPIVAWYDFWVGAYLDRSGKSLYVLPIPCIGFRLTWD